MRALGKYFLHKHFCFVDKQSRDDARFQWHDQWRKKTAFSLIERRRRHTFSRLFSLNAVAPARTRSFAHSLAHSRARAKYPKHILRRPAAPRAALNNAGSNDGGNAPSASHYMIRQVKRRAKRRLRRAERERTIDRRRFQMRRRFGADRARARAIKPCAAASVGRCHF